MICSAPPPVVAPVTEKGKPDSKSEAKPAVEPDVPVAAKPQAPAKSR